VIVYTDKHGPLVARAVPATGEHRAVRIGADFAIGGGVVAHSREYDDLVHHLVLPDLAPTVPLPIPPPPERPHWMKLEIEQGMVRWTDLVPRGEPGRYDWTVRRQGALRLPDSGQRGFPTDREALWARLRERLTDADAPPDGPDILIATAGLPFWVPREAMTEKGTEPPAIWWFPAAYHLHLRRDATRELADYWLAWLSRIGTGDQAVPSGLLARIASRVLEEARQWWWPRRPRVSTGVAPGRVHCGAGRLVGPQVAFPSTSERQYQHAWPPSGQPSGLSSHASPRP
jgi:hypothetical protein